MKVLEELKRLNEVRRGLKEKEKDLIIKSAFQEGFMYGEIKHQRRRIEKKIYTLINTL